MTWSAGLKSNDLFLAVHGERYFPDYCRRILLFIVRDENSFRTSVAGFKLLTVHDDNSAGITVKIYFSQWMRRRTVSGLQSWECNSAWEWELFLYYNRMVIFLTVHEENYAGLHSKGHIFNSARGEPQGRDSCQSDSQREIREADIQHCQKKEQEC
jgi:hypothetical protein